MANHVPLTPSQDGYVSVKTPEGHFSSHEAKSGVSTWSKRYRYVGNFAQLLILFSMALYVFGQVAYFTPVYSEDISGSLKSWWGVPKTQTGGRGGGGGGGGAPAMQGGGGGGAPGMTMPGNATMGGGAGSHGNGNGTMAGGFGGRGNSTMGGGRGNGTVGGGEHFGGRGNSSIGDHGAHNMSDHADHNSSDHGSRNVTSRGDHGEGGRGNHTDGGRGLQAVTLTRDEHDHGPPASGAPAGGQPGSAPGGGRPAGGAPASSAPAQSGGKPNGGGGGGGGRGGPTKGHNEMVLPTFFLLFGMLPLFVSGLLIEFLRHFNLRRISSHYMLKVALVLRRKPALFGRVSYWSYGEWIFFWLMVGGNIFVFYRFYSPRIKGMRTRSKTGVLTFNSYMETIGLTFGYSCIFNMAFLFLPATRNCAWMEFFNISYANGIKYHRWLGVLTVLTGVLHCVGYYWVWVRQGRWQEQSLPCFDCSLADRKGYHVWFNVFGEIALIIFLIIGFTSIPVVRRKFYNVFYYSHQLLFLAVIFSVMHWGSFVWWIFPTFIVYCYSRAVSMSSNFAPIQVKELTAIDDDIVKVVIKRSTGRDGHYRVGQFLYLNVPAISKLQWHAFTIASSPRTSPTTVTVLLKSLGDWTQDLVTHANECKEKNVLPTVYVDGFYGASLEMYDEYSTVCLVGGGIGATPMFAILEDLAAKLENHETLQQKVVFIFSFRELALLEEVHPVLMRLKELDPQEKYFKTHFYLTRLPSEEVLGRRIDTDRLQGKHIQPTSYETTNSTPIAFTEPLRSRTYRALAFTTVVVVGVVLLVYLEFGGGKIQRGTNRKYWPLQQFVDPAMAMVAACIVFAYIFAERLAKRQATTGGVSKEVEMNVFQNVGTPALTVSDVHTYRDLLTHYNVVQGERPNTKALMAEAFEFHSDASIATYGKRVVGVFVSGPEAMKRAVEYAAHEIGTRHFDIHEEEFEM